MRPCQYMPIQNVKTLRQINLRWLLEKLQGCKLDLADYLELLQMCGWRVYWTITKANKADFIWLEEVLWYFN